MSDDVPFDEFRLIMRVPADLEDAACALIERPPAGQPFRLALRRAVRHLIRQYPDLDPVRVRISG